MRLLDEPFDPPDDVQQRSRAFIARVRWTFATTMPQWPHWYVVRARTPRHLRDAYDQLWRDLIPNGYRGRFGRNVPTYYMNVDRWRYWSCDTVSCVERPTAGVCPHARLGVGCVINRALNDDLPPVQLSLGVER